MKQRLRFTKMHGLGNDFILVDAVNQRIRLESVSELAKQLCDRNFGIGADGLILAMESESSDLQMRVLNSDGSEPEMCGNGIRCFSKFVYENKIIEKDVFSVETLAGIMVPALILKEGLVQGVEVDMGAPVLNRSKIPVSGKGAHVVNEQIVVDDMSFNMTCVSMGNPHAVIFVDDLKALDLNRLGPLFEKNKLFPEQINTEFVQILNSEEVVAVVWERGAGETLACGTGACATVVAGVLNKKLNRKALVHLPGGSLSIEWQSSDDHVMMTGPASQVFKGEIDI